MSVISSVYNEKYSKHTKESSRYSCQNSNFCPKQSDHYQKNSMDSKTKKSFTEKDI